YAIAQLTLEAVLKLLEPARLADAGKRIALIRAERERLTAALAALPRVVRVWPSAANFVLGEFTDAGAALERARDARLLVRDARGYPGLGRALRITIGSIEQNNRLLEAWRCARQPPCSSIATARSSRSRRTSSSTRSRR